MGCVFIHGPTRSHAMSVTAADVHYLARLARLRFSEEEEQRLAGEMSRMLDYVDQLAELDTAGVPPMTHVLDLANVFREDEPAARITHDDALRNAPDADADYFRVPKVIE